MGDVKVIRKDIGAVYLDLGDTLVAGGRQWAPGAKAALKRFKFAGIPMGIISNTGHLTRQQLLDQHLPADFSFDVFEDDLVVLSSEVGVSKPDAQIFGIAVDRANICPHEILFCGESLEEVLAAQRAGLCALQVAIEKDGNGTVAESNIDEIAKTVVAYNQA